jgi:hypothetical protein
VVSQEAKIDWITNDFNKALENKDRLIAELQQKRTLVEVEETRHLMQSEATLRNELDEREREISKLEAQLDEAS